uniref:Pentatricopeptide repeat-containing protein At3g18110, chloroplastic n=1 Tax=Anthurium amnicola TaxID=1678845 RepID=A0A1D1YXL6_9ARAE
MASPFNFGFSTSGAQSSSTSSSSSSSLPSCATPCPSAAAADIPAPKPFTYDRASPAVRWPDIDLSDYYPELSSSPSTGFPPPLPPEQEATDPGSRGNDLLEGVEVDGGVGEGEEDEEDGGNGPLEASEERRSRTRAKKMTKLALKRAKDWRQRVQLLVDRILALGPSDFVADVLDKRLVQVTPTDLCFVVKWVGRSSWRRALEVFEYLSLRHWHSAPAHNPRMLATIISVLGRHRQDALAEEVFCRATAPLSSSGSGDALAAVTTVQVYNAMMGVHARAGRFEKVQELLEVMRGRGCEPDLVSFNTLINARAKSGRVPPGSALELLAEVRRSGLRPDTVTYNTLISACSYGGSSCLEDAVKVFAEMAASRCQPDLWTYNAMVSVYGRCGMPREAERLVHQLGENGFSPDAVTYNSLLYAYAREGDAEKVEKLCRDMEKAGFGKDEITYNTIIHMYGKQGRQDLAFQFYGDMKMMGCKPDAITLTVLIDSLGKAGRIMEAGDLMSEMLDSGVKPTLRTYSALICGYAKAGMLVEAEQMFDHMLRSGIKPDNLAYSVMLDILLKGGDVRKMMVLYRDMIRNGFKPDKSLYLDIVVALKKEGMDDSVEELVKDMEKAARMNPQLISSILIKAEYFDWGAEMLKRAVAEGYDLDEEALASILNVYSSAGRNEKASTLVVYLKEHSSNSYKMLTEASIIMLCKNQQLEDALEEYNKLKTIDFVSIDISCSVYESLIACCEENGTLSEACQLFSDMTFFGIEPSQCIYQCMVSIYCKIGFPETAQHLLDRAESAGLLFDNCSPHIILIETYGRLKLWQRAESLVGELRNQYQSKLDRKVWNALIYAYAGSGRYEQARVIFNIMIRDGPSPSVDSVNGLLEALIVDGRLDELYVVIQELQDMNFKISKSTILLMLDAFARAGNIFEVKKIYHGMKAAGYLPTMHLYRSMISLLARGKRVKDVELMVAEMEEVGFKPDLTIFNSMLKMYMKVEDFRKTIDVYQKIFKGGFQADEETYNTLISMYCKDRRPEEGLSLLDEMKRQGLEPKVDTYKSLIAACGREQLWEQAEDLFQSILSKGCRLDRSVYHVMMKIHRDSGNHSKAEHVLFLMKEAGVEPTIATMHILMVSYGTAGRPQEAESVLNSLKSSSLDLSTLPYTSLIDAYLKNGDYNMGIKKMLEMKADGVEPDHRIWTCFVHAASLCHETSQGIMLLNSLCDTGFDLPIRLLTEKTESLIIELDSFLDQLGSQEDASFNFVNALEDLLWAFEHRASASWVFQLAVSKGIYRQNVFRVAEKDWGADFRKLSAGAALVGLTLWLDHMQDASLLGVPESPKSVVLITGTALYNMVSLNNTLKAYLWEMGSPFLPCKTRSGLLVAKAHSLRMWLKDSSFCMDLELKDASSLPKSNSIQLIDGYFMRAGLVPAFKDIHERLGQVGAKKFARLALLSDEKREKAITADIMGRKEKLEKMKKKGVVRARKPTRLRTGKFMRRRHQGHMHSTSS